MGTVSHVDPPPQTALYLLSITYIRAAAQNRWQNNVFKGLTLQLMASPGGARAARPLTRVNTLVSGRAAQFPAQRDLK